MNKQAPTPDDPRWMSADAVVSSGKYWAMRDTGGPVIIGAEPVIEITEEEATYTFTNKIPVSIEAVDVFLLGTEFCVALDGASPRVADYADEWIGPLDASELEPVEA